MNNITIFNNDLFGEVRTMLIDEEAWFVGKDVAEALGYAKPQNAVATHVDEDDTLKQGIIDKLGREQQTTLINESGMYSLIFGSKKPEAKAFKKWVTSEVLPTLRKSGVFITEHAEQETIDYQARYGKYRIRKTFENTKDIRAEYEQYFELSKIECKAHHINNKDRINGSKIIINMIQEKIANEVQDMRPSELLALQELVNDIQTDITKLSNKLNGGKKSALTKQIKKLEQQVEELTPMDLVEEDSDDEYYFIDKSGFTVNCMYSHNNNHVTKSPAYLRWINNLHLENYLPKQYPNVDFTKPLKITILFGQKRNMDTNNLGKAIIDQVANYYGFNDVLVHEVSLQLHDYVDTYEQGYMYIKIQNI